MRPDRWTCAKCQVEFPKSKPRFTSGGGEYCNPCWPGGHKPQAPIEWEEIKRKRVQKYVRKQD